MDTVIKILTSEHQTDIEDSLRNYPLLKLNVTEETAQIEGVWQVKFGETVIDEFQVKIKILPGYPGVLPHVYETGGKITRHRDRHLNPPNWSACLFVEDARWEVWPLGSSFVKFLQVPVHNFFLAQATFNEYGSFRDGEYGHGDKGIKEYYLEKLKVSDAYKAWNLLYEAMAKNLPPKCPCNSGKDYKHCHQNQINVLAINITLPLIRRAYEIFFREVQSEISGWHMKKVSRESKIFSLSPDLLLSWKKD